MRRLGLACLGLLAVGCALTPDYEQPELGLPDDWLERTDAGESIANLAWWELYQDEILQGLIWSSLAENQDLYVALAGIQESSARLTFTRADQFPFVDVFGDASRFGMSEFVAPGASPMTNVGFVGQLTFEVDLWRKFGRATEGARADLVATEADFRAVTISLVASVAETYFLLRDFDARLAISERTVKTRRDALEIIRARFDKGTVPELDVNQAEIEVAIAEVAVALFQRQVAQTENALRVLVGRFPGRVLRGQTLELQPVLPEVPPGLPSELLQRRPDLVAAEQRLIAETARIGVAEALRWPSLSLTGSIGTVADELADLNSNEAKAFNLAANLFMPVFNSGRLKAQAREQRAFTEQVLLDYERSLRQAFREVEDALVAVRTFQTENEARVRQVVAARNAARLSRARYDAGVVDYLEVLDTERTLFSAELEESATRAQALISVTDLYKALGGGWSGPAPTP